MKRGEELTLEIESLAFGGRGLARANGRIVFVEGAIPGQRVLARVFRKRRGYAEARVVDVLAESSQAVEPRCPYFGECGGCSLQNLNYDEQLRSKKQQVEDCLRVLPAPAILDTIPSPDEFYYRNKMEFSFGDQRWLSKQEVVSDEITKPKDFALGLHVRGRFDKILDVDTCYLQSPQSVGIVNYVRRAVLESGIPAYNTRDHSGYWRHLVIREGKNTDESMVNLVTAEREGLHGLVDHFCQNLAAEFPRLSTIVHSINRKKAQVAIGDAERVLKGSGSIHEKIGPRVFRISAHSFFQTNTRGAELLYDKVLQLGEFKKGEIVFDLYSGAGTISLYLADYVDRVIGFELMGDAVRDARVNCELNDVQNCQFVEGDLKDTLVRVASKTGMSAPDTIVVDPPRAGIHPKVVQRIIALQPAKVVYVSCNPSTFARDAKLLCDGGFQLKMLQPVDMFPHTAHIELVSLFTKPSGLSGVQRP